MEFYALVEERPNECIVAFRELPGCFSKASTVEKAIQQAPEVISVYLRWLKQNDIFFFEDEITSIDVVLKEHLRENQVGPRFEADLPAPTDQEIDNALNVAATARAQIIDVYDEVSPDLRGHELKPGMGSLTQHLQHILAGEAYYVACLSDQQRSAGPAIAEADLLRTFVENAMDYETSLRELTPEQRTHIYIHGGEEWTAAKVLRRLTRYLREYCPWMQALARQLTSHSS